MKKGQGATEYLVLLAVVLIVALVAIALLGFFPQLGGTAKVTQSKSYWQGAEPLAITSYKITNANVALVVQNNGQEKLNVTNISLDGTNIIATSYSIASGKKLTITGTVFPAGTCSGGVGDNFQFQNVTLTYNTPSFNAVAQSGQPFIGQCS